MIGTPSSQKNPTFLVLATLLALLLVCPGQASAQGSASALPDASQYGDSSAPAMDVADIPPTVSDNVDDGTGGSVNEAMTDRDLSPAAASPAAGSAVNPGGEDLTALPETGGASSAAPVAVLDVLLVGCSLLMLRSSLRGS